MSVTMIVTLVGIVIIAVLGFLGRRKPARDMDDWTVGGRKYGTLTMWFLQAGEVYTTFTFLGMAGLAFAGGVGALYAMPYVPLAYIGLYFIGPVIWRRARARGQLTMSDFLSDFYDSRSIGIVAAVFGVVFLLPYLQLQITGLGLAVELATGDVSSSNASMIVAFVLTVAFVLWAGIRGVATTSYFKDAIMIVILIVLVIMIPAHFHGGIGATFTGLLHSHPQFLTVHAGTYDKAWFVSSMFASTLGVLFMTLPHTWPPLLSARSSQVVRRNYVFLPLYTIGLALPMIVGFAGISVLKPNVNSNGVLLSLAGQAFPAWLVGVVVVATAASAMVPAAGLIIGMTSLISRNIVPTHSPRTQYSVNQIAVVVVTGLALILAIARPDLLANLLLLTYSGLDQLIPAIGLALFARRIVGVWPVLAGLIVGEIVVIWLTFGNVSFTGHINVGIIALVPNIVVVAVGALIERSVRGRAPAIPVKEAV